MKKILSITAFLGLATLALTSCGNDVVDNATNGINATDNGLSGLTNGKANVGFYLTDAPKVKGGYQAVNIDVKAISYVTDSTDTAAWVTLPIVEKVVEITQFTNGRDSLLSNIVLPAGLKIRQVRLILGDNNTIVLNDGTVKSLKVPSGSTSGLKLNVQSTPEVTSGYKVVIDFDAARSIVAKGNGTYSLKPVIRTYIEANTSFIDGYLTPLNEAVRIFTITGQGDTIATVSDTLNANYFRVSGLFSGTYTLKAQNLTTDSIYTLMENVPVLGGTNVQLSTPALPLLIPGTK